MRFSASPSSSSTILFVEVIVLKRAKSVMALVSGFLTLVVTRILTQLDVVHRREQDHDPAPLDEAGQLVQHVYVHRLLWMASHCLTQGVPVVDVEIDGATSAGFHGEEAIRVGRPAPTGFVLAGLPAAGLVGLAGSALARSAAVLANAAATGL